MCFLKNTVEENNGEICVWDTENSKLFCCFCFKVGSQGCTGEMESLGQRTWKHFWVVEAEVVPAERSLLPWGRVCSWLLNVF